MNQLVTGSGAIIRRVASRVGRVLGRVKQPQVMQGHLFEGPRIIHPSLHFDFIREKTQLGRTKQRRSPLRFVLFADSFDTPWPYVQEEVVRMTHVILPGYAEALRLIRMGPREELSGRTVCFFGTEGYPNWKDGQSLFPVVIADEWRVDWRPKSKRINPRNLCVATF